MPSQVVAKLLLVLEQPRRCSGRSEGCREIEVQPDIDSARARLIRSALGVAHEYHRTHRRDGSAQQAM